MTEIDSFEFNTSLILSRMQAGLLSGERVEANRLRGRLYLSRIGGGGERDWWGRG